MSRYKIQRTLGEGTFGSVFAGHDEETGQRVAIKVLKPNAADVVARFQREAQVLTRLDHPGIVKVLESGVAGQNLYIVMELLEGKTLDALHKKARLTHAQLVGIAIKVAEALDYAHGRGVVHRDVKPANIFITRESKVKLLDFGMAKWLVPGESITGSDVFMGTPEYIAPEVVEGQRPVAASDLYSLGAMLYKMLSDKPPFTGPTAVAAMLARVEREPAPLSQVMEGLPPALEALVMGCLKRQPAARYASLRSFAEKARAVLALLS